MPPPLTPIVCNVGAIYLYLANVESTLGLEDVVVLNVLEQAQVRGLLVVRR